MPEPKRSISKPKSKGRNYREIITKQFIRSGQKHEDVRIQTGRNLRLVRKLRETQTNSRKMGDRNLHSKTYGTWNAWTYPEVRQPLLEQLHERARIGSSVPTSVAGVPVSRLISRKATQSEYLRVARNVLSPREYQQLVDSFKADKKGHAPQKEKLRPGLGKLRQDIKSRHAKGKVKK